MADKMSFDQYINNPSGGQVVTNRELYRNMYTDKFNKILVKEEGKINFKVYHKNDNYDTYYIHFKIPTELIANFYYDTVIQLSTTESPKKVNDTLKQYNVRFFSNDPAFVYTFAHAFKKNDLFIRDLEPKMSRIALKKRGEIRNKNNDVFYVKSIYFAYLSMQRYNLFNRRVLNNYAEKYNKSRMLMSIENSDIKIKRRQELSKAKRDESKVVKDKNTRWANTRNQTKIAKTTKTSRISAKTNNVKMTKTSKIIGKRNTS